MRLRSPRHVIAALLLVAGSLALSGCRSSITDDPILRLSSAEALAEGKRLYEEGKFSKARPFLSHAFEVEPAVARAHELRALVDRPNLMVKVPGTDAGVEAFRRLTREGLNINMTLLFSRERYRQIANVKAQASDEDLVVPQE